VTPFEEKRNLDITIFTNQQYTGIIPYENNLSIQTKYINSISKVCKSLNLYFRVESSFLTKSKKTHLKLHHIKKYCVTKV